MPPIPGSNSASARKFQLDAVADGRANILDIMTTELSRTVSRWLNVYDWIGSVFPLLSDYVPEPKTMIIVIVVLLLTMAFMTVALGKLRSK
jgi:hypothetical protein